MKILCLLLSVYVFMLAAKPCCTDTDCRASVIAKKEQSGKTPVKECQDCSPFFTCGTCVGFTINQPVSIQLLTVVTNDVEHGIVYRQQHIEKVALSIWQPPKLS